MDEKAIARLDRFTNLGIVMDAEVIEGDDLTGTQGGTENVFDEHAEGELIDGSDQAEGGLNALRRKCGDERGGRAVIARDGADDALSLGRTRVQTGHGEIAAGLIDRDQIGRIKVQCQVQGKGGA